MKRLTALLAAALMIGQLPLLAQDPADQPPAQEKPAAATAEANADSTTDRPPGEPTNAAASRKSGRAQKWREEVLGWDDPLRVEDGETGEAITQINRSILVLGTVNGDIHNVSGDVAILGHVTGNVSTISGTVTVLGTVDGNVSSVSGNLRIAGNVNGNATTVSGRIDKSSTGRITGQSKSVSGRNWNGNFNWNGGHGNLRWDAGDGPGSLIGAFWFSSFMLMVRSALLIMWVALGCAVAALFQPALVRAQTELRLAPARCAALGFLWVILYWMLMAGFLVLSLMLIGVPLVIILFVFDLGLGIFGMTITFAVVGEWIARKMNHPSVSIYAAVFVGACALGLLRIVPILGSTIWFVAGLFGVGATLASRFGSAGNNPVPQIPAPPLPA